MTARRRSNIEAVRDSVCSRFLIVGAINTAVTYGAYALFLFVGLNFTAANFLAIILGVLVGFKMQGVLVFRNPDNRLFLRFVGFWAIMYLVNIGLLTELVGWGLSPYAAGAVALPVIASLSFMIQNSLIFRRARRGGDTASLARVQGQPENASGGDE